MKQFTYQVTLHPCFDRNHNYDGRHSVLFTPTLFDSTTKTLTEDIYLTHIEDAKFRAMVSANTEDTPEGLELARYFKEETELLYEMSPAEVLDLSREIKRRATDALYAYRNVPGYTKINRPS